MMRSRVLAAMAVLISGAALADPVGHDRLEGPSLPDFAVGFHAANAEQSIREEVPRGESVERWSRMVTTQWFAGLPAQITPADFTRLIGRNMVQACPGAQVTEPRALTVSGRPAAQIEADCPGLASTGKPETFVMLVVAGERDMLVRQVAFRSVPTADDLLWSDAVLTGSVICKPGEDAPPCDRSD